MKYLNSCVSCLLAILFIASCRPNGGSTLAVDDSVAAAPPVGGRSASFALGDACCGGKKPSSPDNSSAKTEPEPEPQNSSDIGGLVNGSGGTDPNTSVRKEEIPNSDTPTSSLQVDQSEGAKWYGPDKSFYYRPTTTNSEMFIHYDSAGKASGWAFDRKNGNMFKPEYCI